MMPDRTGSTLISRGCSASVWRAYKDGRLVAIRDLPTWVDPERTLAVVRTLFGAGIPTPEPLGVEAGRLVMEFVPGPSLEEVLNGPDPGPVDEHMERFAAIQCALHRLTHPGFGYAVQHQTYPAWADFFRHHNRRNRPAFSVPDLPVGRFCHYDFSPKNVLCRNGDPRDPVIIDFDDAVWGDPKFDVAHTRCCLGEHYPDPVVRGYHAAISAQGFVFDDLERSYLSFGNLGKDWEVHMDRYLRLTGDDACGTRSCRNG